MTTERLLSERDIEEFRGMGSKAAKERALAAAHTPAARPAWSEQERPGTRGDPAAERLAQGAWADLARESARLAENAPHVESQLEAMRQANREREQRHRRLAAKRPPDRVTNAEALPDGVRASAGAGSWEQ